jgi:hypothetical protein
MHHTEFDDWDTRQKVAFPVLETSHGHNEIFLAILDFGGNIQRKMNLSPETKGDILKKWGQMGTNC